MDGREIRSLEPITMAPVAKSTSQRGQISIFFSASLVVLVSIIAFVINIGLFVKAKINLQNATDAAAFAGAAAQSRQLTRIAYLNWEMRNIYKEWMYKYYVIGNLNIEDVKNATPADGGGVSNFRMLQDVNAITGHREPDRYNIPSICVHLEGSQTNICRRYAIPGLPEFGSSNLVGAEEASRAFMDRLIGEKINDCIDRTQHNMNVAITWAYNVLSDAEPDQLMAGRGPAILADRQGAWPRAVELAIRIRNLEYAMNAPTFNQSVCLNPGNGQNVECGQAIDQVQSTNDLGYERLVKAFWSGYRNIGGSWEQDEMKNSFTLSELAPNNSFSLGTANNSSYLLFPGGESRKEKPYLDLKLMMVNYAIFYSAMIPRATGDTSGACDVAKVAIPVPGYPLGFYKSPDVLTYYAVKGEAEYYGMFNPFSGGPIKLTAYAAAKPFGGRIGPMLFYQPPNEDGIRGRTDEEKRRSVPYITSLDVVGTPTRPEYGTAGRLALGDYAPGVPLPVNHSNKAFWLVNDDDPVGGRLTDNDAVRFGIPNLVYDFQTPFNAEDYSAVGLQINKISSADPASDRAVGLYNKYQLGKFKGATLGSSVSVQRLDAEIARVRAATTYEAANYLVPTPVEFNVLNSNGTPMMDSFGFISDRGQDLSSLVPGLKRYTNYVYAPLYDQRMLYKDLGAVTSAIYQYMAMQETGMDKYKIALNQGARSIWNMRNRVSGSATGSRQKYEEAARGVSDINFEISPGDGGNDLVPETCNSLAGQFLYFFWAGINPSKTPSSVGPTCPVPLSELLQKYFASSAIDNNFRPEYYRFDYSWLPSNFASTNAYPSPQHGIFSAYVPGAFTGAQENGTLTNPLTGVTETMRRNFYSTKLVSISSLLGTDSQSYSPGNNFAIFSEGAVNQSGEVDSNGFLNRLMDNGEDLSGIKH